jgi:hypothetical protein
LRFCGPIKAEVTSNIMKGILVGGVIAALAVAAVGERSDMAPF